MKINIIDKKIITTNKSFLGFINGILVTFGIKIGIIKVSVMKKINGKKQSRKELSYQLQYHEDGYNEYM